MSGRRNADLLGDLESAVCDLDNMADLAATHVGSLIDDALTRSKVEKVSLHRSEAVTIQFCVYHLNDMTTKLKAAFYAALEAKEDLDA